jgi:hypothetical protein
LIYQPGFIGTAIKEAADTIAAELEKLARIDL